MVYIIGIILLIIVLIIIGLILRKRIYDSVDYYESWKLNVMNRNVASELAKVKELNLQGETKERFETWREDWDTILTHDLANVEELLYDTEHAADRYRFPTAKKNIQKMEAILVETEKKIDVILKELGELLAVEEENRTNIEELAPKIKELHKQITVNRFQYKRAEIRFEIELEDLEALLEEYEAEIEGGNYHKATEIVEKIEERLVKVEEEITEFPVLYKQCKDELPSKLDELLRGINEMKEDGYQIDHLDFVTEINEYQSRLLDAIRSLESTGPDEAKSVMREVEDRMAEMYDQLEEEAIAKNFVDSKVSHFEKGINRISEQFKETQAEVEQLKEAYYFEDADLEKFMSLEKLVNKLTKEKDELIAKIKTNSYAHSILRDELEKALNQLEEMEENHSQFKEQVQNLRKDEVEVRNQLEAMNESIAKVTRKLRNSNLPGVPDRLWKLLDDASEKNERVLDSLDDLPLDMAKVQRALQEAKAAVELAVEHTTITLDQARLTEHVIQYANRYRSRNTILAAQLTEAENLFRQANYESALETAANAIEAVEPGALKRIEKFQEMNVS